MFEPRPGNDPKVLSEGTRRAFLSPIPHAAGRDRVPVELTYFEGLEAVDIFHVLSPVCEPQILRQIITWTKTEATHTHT